MGLLARLTIVAAVLLASLGSASPALACSCIRVTKANAAELISETPVIVEGVFIQRDALAREGNGNRRKTARLRVDYAWKGNLPREISIDFHEGGSCGAVPPLDRPLRLVLYRISDTQLVYGPCSDLLDDPVFDAALVAYKARAEPVITEPQSP